MHIPFLCFWKKCVECWELWKSNSKATKSEDLEWESPNGTACYEEWWLSSSDSGSILSSLKAIKRWHGKPRMLGHFSSKKQSVQMLPLQKSQAMPQTLTGCTIDQSAASALAGCLLWRLQQTSACGYRSGWWPAGLRDLSTWEGKGPLAVNSHEIFSVEYTASIKPAYQERSVIASFRNVNSWLQF